MDTQPVLSLPLQEATHALIENLLASEPWQRYQQAQSRFNANTQAQALLDEIDQCQAKLRQAQARGDVRQEDIERLRHLQSQIQANAVIMDYVNAQQEAINFLREINAEISQLLGLDFAALAQRATC